MKFVIHCENPFKQKYAFTIRYVRGVCTPLNCLAEYELQIARNLNCGDRFYFLRTWSERFLSDGVRVRQ